MKTIINKYMLCGLCLIALLFAGCKKFDEINTNPNKPVQVTSAMLATNLLLDITKDAISETKGFMMHYAVDKYMCWSEFPQDEQYNKFGRASFDGLIILNNVNKMVAFAKTDKLKNSYAALGHFIRAWKFFYLSMQVGDIPYSQALQGESSGMIKPEYDTQKEVMRGVLNELDTAYTLFSQGENFEGDPIYGGDITKWQKAANAFQLRVLINLYKKTGDADLNVTGRFKDIVNNRPLFESNADNFALVYSDQAGQEYPFYKVNNQFTIYEMVSTVLIDTLKAYNDYRLFYFADPSPVQITNGKQADDWDAYIGVDPSIEYSVLSNISSSHDYSSVNSRYLELPQGEPISLISYAQQNFILAEAAVRGWITNKPAADYYNMGIEAAMNFVADNTPDDPLFNHGRKITGSYIQTYVNSPKVKFAATDAAQIKQIITQKYLADYLQGPFDSYYEYRRTGFPVFPINPASNQNVPKDKIPVRWMYPGKELEHNSDNVAEAINRQYSGNDNVNALMWILK